MPKVTFIDHDGVERIVDAENGWSLMEAARNNDVPGILAECGGMCACATCHVYVSEPWLHKLPPAADVEKTMLEFTDEPRAGSRLACQIELSDDLEGMSVTTPEAQI
jgi:2Fe-2S ferredoxin